MSADCGASYWQLHRHAHWPRIHRWLQQPFTPEIRQASIASALTVFSRIQAACDALACREGLVRD